MTFTEIKVDVYCTLNEEDSAYRVYINQEMMTERTIRWPIAKYYVEENIVASLPSGNYTVTVEYARNRGTYEAKNLRIDGVTVQGLTFTV